MLGFRFRRQFSIGSYILDFYCPKLKLDVEVDGESHYVRDGPERDQVRTAFLEKMDVCVVRVPNSEVAYNLDGVLEYLAEVVRKRAAEQDIDMPAV